MHRTLLVLALAALLGIGWTAWHHSAKPLPPGLSVETPSRNAREIRFLADLAYVDSAGRRHVDQEIFDEIFRILRGARERIILDLFLFNEQQGPRPERTRSLCAELTTLLIAQKTAHPQLEIVLITDPINTIYGARAASHLERLREAGISVVMTDLDPLRDSFALYSAVWRLFIRPLGGNSGGLFPNPFGGEPVSLRTNLRILNFKANHRKTLVADTPSGWTALVTSANPHDASSAHRNIALRFDGPAVADLLETERAVAAFSDAPVPEPLPPMPPRDVDVGVGVRIVTEGKIGEALDQTLADARAGDEIAVAVFYLSDRAVIEALVAAHQRGASVRVLLDPNKDAFGLEKNGIPNRPVAAELHRAGIPVRWCDTHGEQCHDKMLLLRRGADSTLLAGSANFTRRNLRDLNLETDVWLVGTMRDPVMQQAWSHFERVWSNEPGRVYSVPYAEYADESWIKRWIYRLGELSGASTY